jgi:hypothetical protein
MSPSLALKKEAVCSSETLVPTYKSSRCLSLEDLHHKPFLVNVNDCMGGRLCVNEWKIGLVRVV